ncbi:hypothetical protein KCU98_g6072, partial [Aureobasidium melanogenum]
KSRLKDVLNAFNACTSLGLEIQLKVLQALPALAQNYADDLKGDHLAAALQVCAALQNVKAATVSGVAAATLQQLVVSVFDRVAAEDEAGDKFPIVTRISGGDGPIPLKEAAYDAYRVFLDICFATEGQNTRFVRFAGLSAASGLELMGTCLGSHPKIFASHREQTNILRTVVMPHLIRIISERQAFGVTLRALRVASFIIRRHLQAMPDECEVVLGLLTHMIDSEATAWKRAMCMEVFRLVYTEPGLAVQIYLQYDFKDGKKSIVRDNIASFVKISTEKPSVIGLGQHSSAPTDQARDTIAEAVAMEAAGGVAGVIAPSSNVADANVSGIKSGWTVLVDRLVDLSITMSIPDDARRLAADILAQCSVAVAEASTSEEPEDAALAQKMVLSSLHLLIRQVYEQGGDLGNVDIDIHNRVLDSVRAVLEKSGEALTAGWETILAIIGSVFDTNDAEEQQQHDEQNRKEGWLKLSSQFVAPYLGRSAFGVMQLVCSDFLAPLPQTCLSPLVEILFRFASQTSDLNISLTAITLFWDVSDFLVKQQVVSGLNELASGITEERLVLGHERIVTRSKESRPAQWVLLMYRLTDVIADERLEVRNSAFQTLLRIFKNHSIDFSNPAWQLAIETLLFKVLRENVEKQRILRSSKASSDVIIGLDSTSSEIIGDITSLLAGQFEQMASLDAFDRLWSDLMEIFEALLSFHSSVINAPVYDSLSTLLGAFGSNNHKLRQAVSRTELLWSSAVPDCSADVKGQTAEQDQYIAYVNCGRSIYGLIEKNASTDRLDKLVQNMIDCVKSSSGAAYSSDVNSLTMLQQKVLEHLRALHGNIELISSTLVNAASQLVSSPFTSHEKPKTNLTFVALSKASMDWLVELIAKDLSRPDMFQSGAVAKALEDLAIPMGLKYRWTQPGRAPALWQKASSASLSIIDKTLFQMGELSVENEMKTRIWTAIINIAHAVMHADVDEASPQPTFETVEKDEVFDCEIMRQLKAMITPTLGSADIPDATRQTYVSSLFNASLIHSVERGDVPQDVSQLDNLYALRMGRVRDPEPSLREDMAYLCFTELVSLVGNPSGGQVKLSQAATSCLVLRFALPLKAYIVDQPLRGSLPQPLSQVEELLFCLTEVEKLQGLSNTMDEVDGAGKTEYQAHLQLLFPLVVKAVDVAGDKRYGNKKVLNLLERVLVAIR